MPQKCRKHTRVIRAEDATGFPLRWFWGRLWRSACVAALAGIAMAVLIAPQWHEPPVVNAELAASHSLARPLEPPACDWHATFAREIRALDGDLDAWRIAPVPLYGQVTYSEQIARIGPTTPCLLLDETIQHEWMHLQQARMYDGEVHERYGGRDGAEVVADCGAWMLGSRVTPYIDPVWHQGYVGPCTPADVMEAWWLIARPLIRTSELAHSAADPPAR
ncbi:MAG: hypothetical protein GEU97_19080 [Actinophytocola sp.]|nr:hypothetical protein [Actinophytocola sp.]